MPTEARVGSLRLDRVEGAGVDDQVVLTGISVVGRDPSCALVIADRSVSREHAVLRPEEGFGFVVEDLDSRSGTFVNGVRTRKAVLQDGDLLKFGAAVLRVRLAAAGLPGEVPPEQVEVVKARFMPTTRLTLDAVRFRAGTRDLAGSTSGLAAALGESGACEAPAPPTPGESGVAPAVPATPSDAPPGAPGAGAPGDVAARLELLCDISTSLAAIHDPARLGRETAVRVFGVFPQARRFGVFELEHAQGGEPWLRPRYLVDRSARERGGRVQISQSVLQLAISERRALLSEDVRADPRFQLSRSLSDAGVMSIVCVPLCLGERILGALYLDATDGGRRFDEGALRLMTGVGAILAASIENARLFARVQVETVRRANLERYFSPDLVERVLKGEVPLARQGALAEGTIVFVDVRGFSQLTDTTPPHALVATLNAYFAAMQRIIFRGGGTVERFGGDSILAYWGVVDRDPEAPARAARAALAMQGEMHRLNDELVAQGRPRLELGIGINTGPVIAGEVGSPERYEFTILGDAVNLARRIESVSQRWEVLVGEATLAALGARALARPLPPVTVKGKDRPVALAALVGLRRDEELGPDGAPERSASGRAGVTRFDLSLRARLLGGGAAGQGDGAEDVQVVGLERAGGRARLEVLTTRDLEPDAPVGLTLRPPRGEPVALAARAVVRAAVEDTVVLQAGAAASIRGVQRARLELPWSPELAGALGAG